MAAEITIKTASECLDQLYTFLNSCGKEAKFKVDDVVVFHNEGHVYLMFAGHAQQDMRLQRRVVDGVEHVFVQYPSVSRFVNGKREELVTSTSFYTTATFIRVAIAAGRRLLRAD